MRGLRLLFAAVLAALTIGPVHAQGLATPAQLDNERALLRILARPEMRAAIRRVEALYRADPQAATAAGKARLRRAASSIATSAADYALAEDGTRSNVLWKVNAPHRWHGLTVPGSGFGIDNPDNIYQGFAVMGGGRYLLHGRIPSPGPVQLHLEVRDTIPGMGDMLVEGGRQLATIQSEQMQIAKDDSFVIAVDSDAVSTAPNHLAIPASGTVNVGIRQLLTDWSSQRPIALRVENVGTPSIPAPRDIARLARRSAEILDRIGAYWLKYDNEYIYSRPANQVSAPRQRPGGRGLSNSGHYVLGDDEALVITADSLGSASLGIQIADPWGVAYDYDRRTSSLNNTQAHRSADGAYTFIIAARDPGVANWLDSGGFASGMLVLRWQGVPAGIDPAQAVRRVAVVKLAGLAAALPAGHPRIDQAARAAERAARARAYSLRLGE